MRRVDTECLDTMFRLTKGEVNNHEVLLLSLSYLRRSVALAPGCATKQTVGDRMSSFGEQAKSLGSQWEEGSKLVDKGQKQRKQAQKELADAEAKLAKADRSIREGRELMSHSENSFAQPCRH